MPQHVGETAEDARRIAMAELLLQARAVVLFVEVVSDQVEPRVGVRLPRQRSAYRIQIAAVDVAVVEQVVREAAALEVQARDADAERVGEGKVEHPLHLLGIEIAVFELACGVDAGEVGLGGDEVDHARGCVAAEQRALRPAQHLDPFKVVELALEQTRRDQRHVVDVDRGRAVAGRTRAEVADAADGEARRREVGLGEADVRERLLHASPG